MYTVSNLDVINRIIIRRPSKRKRKRDYSHMDEQEVRRVVKDYSDMIKRISYNYLQHTYDCFTIAKILGSIIGCLVVAFLCYELSDVTPMNTRLIITGVGTVITILLNIRFWRR